MVGKRGRGGRKRGRERGRRVQRGKGGRKREGRGRNTVVGSAGMNFLVPNSFCMFSGYSALNFGPNPLP